jgi:hypothetical protein
MALGAAAIGVAVFSFCIYLAVSASKKKAANRSVPADSSKAD